MPGGNGAPRPGFAYDEVQSGGYSVPDGDTQPYETPALTIIGDNAIPGYANAMAAPTNPVRETEASTSTCHRFWVRTIPRGHVVLFRKGLNSGRHPLPVQLN